MVKKIILLCMVVVLLFAFSGCEYAFLERENANLKQRIEELEKQLEEQGKEIEWLKNELALRDKRELDKYKKEIKAELEQYALNKGEDNYSEDNWLRITKAVDDAKTAIDAAADAAAVDAVLASAKHEIDWVLKEGPGKFFNLGGAYDEGLLTVEGLHSIRYYYRNGKYDDEPAPKNPESLSKEVEDRIKREYLVVLMEYTGKPYNDPERVYILDYYGTYNNSIALFINQDYFVADRNPTDYDVGGVIFYRYMGGIYIWRLP